MSTTGNMHSSHLQLWMLAGLLGCLCALWARPASAQSQAACTASPAASTINFGSVSAGTPNGPLGNPISIPVGFNCLSVFDPRGRGRNKTVEYDQITIQLGSLVASIDNNHAGPNGGLMLKTGVPGIDIELDGSPQDYMFSSSLPFSGGPGGVPGWELATICYPNADVRNGGAHGSRPCTANNTTGSVGTTIKAQLVKVGPLPTSTTVNEISLLLRFANYTYGGTTSSSYYGSINLGKVTIKVPSCTISTDPTIVTLPSVIAAQFNHTGHTAGETAFNIQLDCPQSASGAKVVVTLDSNAKVPGAHGVIAPTPGGNHAHGVGVQILDGNGDEIDFGSPTPARNVTTGNLNIPFRARYYQTDNQVSGGLVEATATYTLTYQ